MSTPRELYNQILKDEIDRFATRMKELVDHYRAHETMGIQLAREIDRLEKEKADQQVSQ